MSLYSMDLRKKVMAALGRGESVSSVSGRFEVSRRTIGRWIQRQAVGQLAHDRSGPKGPVKLTPADDQTLREALRDQPGLTLLQLRALLSVQVAQSTICRRLKKLELTLKKSH
jgi:transposase